MKVINKNLIRDLVCSQRKTYSQVSEIFKNMFLGKISFSLGTIQRYFSEKAISAGVKQREMTVVYILGVSAQFGLKKSHKKKSTIFIKSLNYIKSQCIIFCLKLWQIFPIYCARYKSRAL